MRTSSAPPTAHAAAAAVPSADWPAVARDLEDWVDDEEVVERLDPVPRVLDGAEWDVVAAGLAQRVRALEAFLRRPEEAVAAGVVPADLVPTSPYAEHRHAPDLPPPVVPIGLAGPDLARDADGAWWVLEDNLRNPTMLWHSVAVAAWLRPRLERPPGLRPAVDPPGAALVDVLRRMLHAAAPGVADPVAAVLSDDHTWHPHSETLGLAELVGVPCVQLGDLRRGPGDRLLLPDGRALDVLWRRTSEERLHDDQGRPNRLGEALLGPLRAGTLAVVNPFGTGVADDKRMLAHADDLVRLHLGEEPLVGAPDTYDLGHPDHLVAALPSLGELVLKPRSGSGGHGVSLPDDPDRARRAAALDAVRAEPAGWVAQRPVELERVPSWTGRDVAWRPVDLRAFVVSTGAETWVLTGGASRASAGTGRVTNLSQGGGSKDTWVVDGVVDGASASAVGSEDLACDPPTG